MMKRLIIIYLMFLLPASVVANDNVNTAICEGVSNWLMTHNIQEPPEIHLHAQTFKRNAQYVQVPGQKFQISFYFSSMRNCKTELQQLKIPANEGAVIYIRSNNTPIVRITLPNSDG